MLKTIYQGNFSLNYCNETIDYADSFIVPNDVWDTTYGELSFKYSLRGFSYELSHIGFRMTHVENVWMKYLQEQLANLTEVYEASSKAYSHLNESCTYVSKQLQTFKQNYTQLNETYVAFEPNVPGAEGKRRWLETARNTIFIFLTTT